MIEDELRAYNFIGKKEQAIIQRTETSEKQKAPTKMKIKSIEWHVWIISILHILFVI